MEREKGSEVTYHPRRSGCLIRNDAFVILLMLYHFGRPYITLWHRVTSAITTLKQVMIYPFRSLSTTSLKENLLMTKFLPSSWIRSNRTQWVPSLLTLLFISLRQTNLPTRARRKQRKNAKILKRYPRVFKEDIGIMRKIRGITGSWKFTTNTSCTNIWGE